MGTNSWQPISTMGPEPAPVSVVAGSSVWRGRPARSVSMAAVRRALLAASMPGEPGARRKSLVAVLMKRGVAEMLPLVEGPPGMQVKDWVGAAENWAAPVLLATIELKSEAVVPLMAAPSPPPETELKTMVQLRSVAVEVCRKRPPPPPLPAELRAKRQLRNWGWQLLKASTPPARWAVLAIMVQRSQTGLQLVAMSHPPPKLPPLLLSTRQSSRRGLEALM